MTKVFCVHYAGEPSNIRRLPLTSSQARPQRSPVRSVHKARTACAVRILIPIQRVHVCQHLMTPWCIILRALALMLMGVLTENH